MRPAVPDDIAGDTVAHSDVADIGELAHLELALLEIVAELLGESPEKLNRHALYVCRPDASHAIDSHSRWG